MVSLLSLKSGVIYAMLTMHLSNGCTKIWLESHDSIYLVNLGKSLSIDIPWKLRHAWLFCLSKMRKMNICISNIYRKGNQVADGLVSHGLHIDFFF